METRAQRIEALLRQALPIERLEIVDESARHAGHAGANPAGESHYRLTLTSPAFAPLSRVEQHQLIYKLLASELQNGLHALSINTGSVTLT